MVGQESFYFRDIRCILCDVAKKVYSISFILIDREIHSAYQGAIETYKLLRKIVINAVVE